MIYVGFDSLIKLQGVRTTLCFIVIILCTSTGLFTGFIPSAAYLEFMKWAWGIYAGAKIAFKGTEVAKAKINGKE